MKKASVAAILIVLCAGGCKQHTNNAKPVPIAIREVVKCVPGRTLEVSNPRTKEKVCVAPQPIVTEDDIRDATLRHNDESNNPEVMVYLDRDGGARMYEATQRISARHDNGQLAIVLDGRLISAPTVRGPIRDSLIIEGGFTEQSAQDLADILSAGK